MDVEKFIDSQKRVIAESGIDAYLPAIWVKRWFSIRVGVLADGPDGPELEAAAKAWAMQVARRRDYLLGVRVSSTTFKVISRAGGRTSEQLVDISAA